MIIKDSRGRSYTLTSNRLAEVNNNLYYSVFSTTKAYLTKALKARALGKRTEEVEYDFKRADADGHPIPQTKWKPWSDHIRFPFNSDLTQIGCAFFPKKVANLIRKTMGLNVRKTTRG